MRLSLRRERLLARFFCAALPVFFFLSVLPASSQTAQPYAQNEETLRVVVGADRNYPPYEFEDEAGMPIGFNIDLIREVARTMGFEVHIRTGPWSEIRQDFESDKIDILSGMFYSEERDGVVDFSIPHIVAHHAVFVRKGSSAHSLEDLKGKEIIVQRGDIMHDYVKSLGLTDSIIAVPDQADALRLLASGRHDGALLSKLQGQYFLNKLNLTNVETTGPAIMPRDYCFAVSEGNRVLLSKLNEGLQILNNTGAYKRIRDKWFGVYEHESSLFYWKIAAWVLLSWLSIAALTWLWNRSLKREVKRRTEEMRQELSLRMQAEEALKESEARYRELVENANSIILRLTPSGEITFFNEFAQGFFGFSQQEIIGQNVVGTIVPETESSGRNLSSLILDLGRNPDKYRNNENENMLRSGGRVWVAWTNKAIYGPEGRLEEILCVGNDITARKRAEEALFESEQRYRTLFETASDAILVAEEQKLVDCNSKLLEMFRCAKEDLMGTPPHFLSPSAQPNGANSEAKARELIGKALDGHAQFFEWRHCRSDGEPFDAEVSLSRFDLWGKRFLLGILRDITDRKRSERALQETKEALHALIKASPVPIMALDVEGRVTMWNPASEAVFGWKKEEVLGQPTPVALSGELKGLRDQDDSAIGGDSFTGIEAIRRRKDGSPIEISISAAPMHDAEGRVSGIMSVMMDITERNRLEAQLRQAQKLEAIGTLAGGIAHDFNNILAAIIGYTELSLQRLSASDPIGRNLEEVRRASMRAKDLVKQILSFSRMMEREERLVLDVVPVMKEGIRFIRASLPTSIELSVDIPKTPMMVMANPTHMHQILLNLCTNASHAMEEGGLLKVGLSEIRTDSSMRLHVPGLHEGRYIQLSVSDTGHGMDKAVMERIFDPYFTTKQVGKGSGLGLAVVHGIVKRYGGAIRVQSERGKGALFEIFIPVADSTARVENNERVGIVKGDGQRILLVDDEQALVEVGQAILSRLGYEVVATTTDSVAALELFRREPGSFDLIITDYTMPHMTGLDLSKEILSIKPEMPIILCTGFSEKISEQVAKEAGIRELAMKPVTLQSLSEMIQKALFQSESDS